MRRCFYPTVEDDKLFTGNVWNMDGTFQYLKHYDNFLYLKFMSENSDRQEKL
jgi:hypothetical protein